MASRHWVEVEIKAVPKIARNALPPLQVLGPFISFAAALRLEVCYE